MHRLECLGYDPMAGVGRMHLKLTRAIALDQEQTGPTREGAIHVCYADMAGLRDPGHDGIERLNYLKATGHVSRDLRNVVKVVSVDPSLRICRAEPAQDLAE